MKKKIGLLLLLVTSLTATANASEVGLFVEPYLGYNVAGNLTINGTDQGSFTGLSVGSRLGVKAPELFFGGLDFAYNPANYIAFPTGGTIFNGNPYALRLGVILGLELPTVPFRFWVAYNFLDKLNGVVPSLSTQNAMFNGNSFKLGLGYRVLPLMSLNAEFIASNYGDISVPGATIATANTNSKTLLISASLPLAF